MDALGPSDIFLFGDFRLDRSGLFRRDQTDVFVPVKIGSRALDILTLLLERCGYLLTKEEILASVWPKTAIVESNLTVQIAALRRVLDQGRTSGSCIQTISGRGYRFVVPVTRREADGGRPAGYRVQIVPETSKRDQVIPFVISSTSSPEAAPGMPNIGYLGVSHRSVVDEFCRSLAAYGYVNEHTVKIHFSWCEGDYSRYPALVQRLLEIPVELIVADATPAVSAVKKATQSIPIVMVGVGDPVAYGIVPSLLSPSGNITGMSGGLDYYQPRNLRLLKEMMPDINRVAILAPGTVHHAGVGSGVKSFEDAAHALDISTRVLSASTADELRDVLAQMDRRVDALVVIPDQGFLLNRQVILAGAAAAKIPVVCPYPEYVPDGALMSLGPNRPEVYRRLGYFVDMILKGTSPSALPVEEPTKHWLSLNLNTARTLRINIPAPILSRADELFE